jgi:D-mannonate dehydratase
VWARDVLEATRAFAHMGKLWKIHFRNVSASIPGFVETFVDNGYMDMKQVMRTLVAVDFRGILIPDHVPQMIGAAFQPDEVTALLNLLHRFADVMTPATSNGRRTARSKVQPTSEVHQ